MKRLSLAIMFVFCTLTMAAQDGIQVLYEGAQPNIYDFACAFIFQDDGDAEDCDHEATSGIAEALERYRQNENQNDNVTLVVDKKGGFISYKHQYQGHTQLIEMCYWNEADKKHKLFAFSNWSYFNDLPDQGQYDTLVFLRYTNATKKMEFCASPGFEVTYEQNTTYSLPRVGKDIIINKWDKDGLKTQKILKWNGHGFNK